MDNGVVIVGSSQVGPAPIIDDDGNVLAELETEPVYATVEIGRLLSGRRWPQSPPAHQNRRNLTTGERNASVWEAIATFAQPK
jgi:hypothetical protein